jgi:hypothetical protein
MDGGIFILRIESEAAVLRNEEEVSVVVGVAILG